MNFLISGCAGFIGYHISDFLCKKYKRSKVIGFDNLNNFYSIKLKKKRISNLKKKTKIFSLRKLIWRIKIVYLIYLKRKELK